MNRYSARATALKFWRCVLPRRGPGLFCAAMLAGMLLFASVPAQAQESAGVGGGPGGAPANCLCTNSTYANGQACFDIQYPTPGTGIISLLVANIGAIVGNVGMQLYTQIIANSDFQFAVRAALTLYVIIFGILFIFGMIQSVFMDFIIRLVKFGIIASLLSQGSWTFFYSYVGRFFNDGTNWLIGVMASIALGSVQGVNPNAPFAIIDNAITEITSSRMLVTTIATLFTGPYGPIIGGLIVMSLVLFTKSVFEAMWIYLMSMVVRSFLFALAPMFFCFLLFQRTRNLFDGWLNALVSSMLQPVFLFAFFAFFIQLVTGSINNLLMGQNTPPVCFSPPGPTMPGTPIQMEWWRFAIQCILPNGQTGWCPTGVMWNFMGNQVSPGNPVFPLDVPSVLILFGLVYVMSSFVRLVPNFAKEISGVHLNLSASGAITELFSRGTRLSGLQQAAGKAAQGSGQSGSTGGMSGIFGKILQGIGVPTPGADAQQTKEQVQQLPTNRPPPR